MIICHCKRVSGSVIEDALAAGAASLSEVSARCQAGTKCGSCLSSIEALLAAAATRAADGLAGAAVAA